MHVPLLLLAGLPAALAIPAPAPTAAANLDARAAANCQTKTLFGPYTFSYPIFGYAQSDTFYVEELPSGAYEISGHGYHEVGPILVDNDQPALILDPAGGFGGAIVGTESIAGKTYIGTLGGTLAPQHTECPDKPTTTVTVTKTDNPFWPTGFSAAMAKATPGPHEMYAEPKTTSS